MYVYLSPLYPITAANVFTPVIATAVAEEGLDFPVCLPIFLKNALCLFFLSIGRLAILSFGLIFFITWWATFSREVVLGTKPLHL